MTEPSGEGAVPAPPKDVKKILVPVDYSVHSRRAVEHAHWLQEKVGAETVDVLHVGVRPATYLPLDQWIWGEDREQHQVDARVKQAAEQALDEFVGALPSAVADGVGTRLELGVPWKRILEVAADYDMIVMGSHGRTASQRFLLGSVAERVVRSAPCPVLTVR